MSATGSRAPVPGEPARQPAPFATSLLRHPALTVQSHEAPGGEALQ